ERAIAYHRPPQSWGRLTTRMRHSLARSGRRVQSSRLHEETVLFNLAQKIELRDAETSDHCERLAQYATALGESLGLGPSDLKALRLGGYFHDIGKIAIPDAILLKPSTLTAEEYEQMKMHTIIGEEMCGDVRMLRPVRPIVRSHHERLDG